MAKKLAIVFGAVFVLVGVLGFISNPIVGVGGLFLTNTTHDLVHIVFGLILLAAGLFAPQQSGLWLKVLGVVYLVVALLGFLMPSPLLGLIEVNSADNWLHVLLGVALLAGSMWVKDGSSMTPEGAPRGGMSTSSQSP